MTGIGSVMKGAGYKTYFTGKWDTGMATYDHTPRGRGYDASLVGGCVSVLDTRVPASPHPAPRTPTPTPTPTPCVYVCV